MIRYNPTKRRIEALDLSGTVIGVYPPTAVTPEEDAAGVMDLELTDPATKAAADRYLAGDTNAAADLDAGIVRSNQRTAQAVQASTSGTGTGTGAGTAGPQGQGALLPSAAYLLAYTDVLRDSASLIDADTKLRLKEQQIRRAAKEYGITLPEGDALYGEGEGLSGPFAASMGAISALAATNPDYLRAFGGINNLAGVVEINRRQNVLASVADRLQQEETQRAKGTAYDEAKGRLAQVRRGYQEQTDALVGGSGDPRAGGKLGRLNAAKAADEEQAKNDLWRTMHAWSPRMAAQWAAQEKYDRLNPWEKRAFADPTAPIDPNTGVAIAPDTKRLFPTAGAYEPPRYATGGVTGGFGAPSGGSSGGFGGGGSGFGPGPATGGESGSPYAPSQGVDDAAVLQVEQEAFARQIAQAVERLEIERARVRQEYENARARLQQAHQQRMAQVAARRQAMVAENPYTQMYLPPPPAARAA